MAPRFLVRFDDLCPTMDRSRWSRVEAAVRAAGVRPLVAVVPDNVDPELEVDPPDPQFWERVRGWQAEGWSIGLHGHRHRYCTTESGLVGINQRSELAGRPAEEQSRELAAGLDTFAAHGVTADVFVAPSHSFDHATVTALVALGLPAISDGFGLRPTRHPDGSVWVPQQLWRFRSRPFGWWTVCLHPNTLTDDELARFTEGLAQHRHHLTTFDEALRAGAGRPRGPLDRIAATTLRAGYLAKRSVGSRLAARRTGTGPDGPSAEDERQDVAISS